MCVGDYDNDGWQDLFVTYYGKNRLYHNDHGVFKLVSEKAGVAGNGKEWGAGCAFVDYDRDGHLDLFVANYVDFDVTTAPAPGDRPSCMWKGAPVMCGPRGLPHHKNILYHNRGDGTFEDVTVKAHIDQTNGHYGLGVSTLDYDNDGWPDIYVACDSTPSILYHNNRDGTFTDVAVVAGAAFNEDGREQGGMGTTVGDYDGDGRLDIFKTNFSDDTSSLYHNNPDGTFTDVTTDAGLGLYTKYLGWGTMFFDFDNDSWPDLMLVNGHVYPEVDKFHLGSNYQEPRILYRNNGNAHIQRCVGCGGPGHHDHGFFAWAGGWRPVEHRADVGGDQHHERSPQPAEERAEVSQPLDCVQDRGNEIEPRWHWGAHHGAGREAAAGRRSAQRIELLLAKRHAGAFWIGRGHQAGLGRDSLAQRIDRALRQRRHRPDQHGEGRDGRCGGRNEPSRRRRAVRDEIYEAIYSRRFIAVHTFGSDHGGSDVEHGS